MQHPGLAPHAPTPATGRVLRHRAGAGPLAAALAILLLGGCGKPPPLMDPGARQVTFQLWGEPGEPPAIIQAMQLSQHGATFDQLQFEELTVRRPFDEGVLVLSSPSGTYQREGIGTTLTLDGPVHFSGSRRGEPLVGIAEHAVMLLTHGIDHELEMTGGPLPEALEDPQRQVVIVYLGRAMRSWRMLVSSPDVKGAKRRLSITMPDQVVSEDSPALGAVLAALPRPLILPGVLPVGYGPSGP